MSGGYSALRWLQVGTQTGTTDVPAEYVFINPQGDVAPTANQGKVPVDIQRSDGEITAPVLGAKSGGFSFTGLVRGKGSGAGVVSGAGVAAVGGEFDKLFDALFGAAGSHGTGTTSGTTHDTDTIKMADTSGHPAGNGLLIDSDPTAATRYEAREVISISTNTSVELDRVLQGTPANATVAYASTSWYADADDSDHSHLRFLMEGESWARDFLGCAVKLTLNCPAGGLAQWQWEVMANDWEDIADGSLTYSSPTSAAALSVLGSPFYIGATKTELIECSLDFGFEPQPRLATEGANGQNGWIYNYTGAKFNFKVYHNDTTMNTLQSASTVDLAFQLGDMSSSSTPGNCLYTRIPAFACDGNPQIETFNGVDAISVSGIATRPSSGTGSLRMHLFASAA